MKYILDTSKLKPCDIILTRNKQLPSKLVRLMSTGAYSHALCCLTKTSLIEATMKGRVFSENPQRLLFENIDDCRVLRSKKELNQEEQNAIILFLRCQVSTRYSVKEALSTGKYQRTDKTAKEDGQFCSRLVAQAFNKAGIKLVDNPNYCSPESLNASTLLQSIPNTVRMATDEEIDYCKTPSQIKDNQIENYKWLDKVAELAKVESVRILSQYDAGAFLISHPKYDKTVCDYIKETNYLTQYLQDEIVSPYRYKYGVNVPINILAELHANKEQQDRQLINYAQCRFYNEKTNLDYFLLMKDMYENILKQISARLGVLMLYLNADIGNSTEKILLIKEIDGLQEKIKEFFIDDNYTKYILPQTTT